MLVGRDRDVARLRPSIERGEPVVVVGEPGVGKTTLVRAAAAAAGRTLHEAGGLATLSWLPYLPVTRTLGRTTPPDGDASYVAAALERVVGDGALLVDDLQWVDAETRSVLRLLEGRLPVVATLRRGDPGAAGLLAELAERGVERLDLEPLDDDAAAALVAGLRPGLHEPALRRIVRAAGGNPLLLEELAADGRPSESLQLALRARLRLLTREGAEAMALLAVAGRPLDETMLGPGAVELVEAGLALPDGFLLAVRHALLAETAVEALDDTERKRVHARLARALPDPGEAARHHAAAGERGLAFEQATGAAERAFTPGERAAHLGLAAACADGPDADELRIRAASQLVQAGRSAEALALLAAVATVDPRLRAEACLVEWHAASASHELGPARDAWERGTALAAGSGWDVEVLLRIEETEVAATHELEPGRALVVAEEALALAQERGVGLARARYHAGAARLDEGVAGWEEELRAALDASLREGDFATANDAVGSLVYGMLVTGRAERGRDLAEAMATRAAELRLLGMERWLRAWLCGFLWHTGDARRAVEEAAPLVEQAAEPRDLRLAEFYLAQALVECGRYGEAREVLDAWRATVGPGHATFRSLLWALADLELWSGRPAEAAGVADECLARFPGEGAAIFVRLTQAWALYELERDPGEPVLAPYHPMGEGAPPEERAVCALAAGRAVEALPLLDDAARLWAGRHARGELRCRWAAGEAARLAGDAAGARARLVAAEARAEACGSAAVLARVRRSLRLVGETRSAARGSAAAGLTKREHEVLALVGEGLSNAEIARRLGVGRPTVVRLVHSASTKLGAATRLQAAALAARL